MSDETHPQTLYERYDNVMERYERDKRNNDFTDKVFHNQIRSLHKDYFNSALAYTEDGQHRMRHLRRMSSVYLNAQPVLDPLGTPLFVGDTFSEVLNFANFPPRNYAPAPGSTYTQELVHRTTVALDEYRSLAKQKNITEELRTEVEDRTVVLEYLLEECNPTVDQETPDAA